MNQSLRASHLGTKLHKIIQGMDRDKVKTSDEDGRKLMSKFSTNTADPIGKHTHGTSVKPMARGNLVRQQC